jgi:hypothetical protein
MMMYIKDDTIIDKMSESFPLYLPSRWRGPCKMLATHRSKDDSKGRAEGEGGDEEYFEGPSKETPALESGSDSTSNPGPHGSATNTGG